MNRDTTTEELGVRASRASLRVVTSHPGKQVVVYHIAVQLAIRRSLAAHLAAVYYVPTRCPYNFGAYVPGGAGRGLRRQLLKRRCDALPDELVVDWPGIEFATRTLQALPGLKSLLAYRRVHRAVDIAHDTFAANWIRGHRDIDIVMPHQGSALRTLHATRDIGAHSVLVVHHPLSHNRIVTAEYKKLGGSAPPPLSPRYRQEIEAADYLLTPSALTTDSLLEVGVPAAKIKEIPWGIDTTGRNEHATRKAVDQVRFLFVGKLSIHKGLHILRDAWSSMTRRDVSLTLVGRPREALEAELVRTWQDDRVDIVAEVQDINTAYQNADVFVFPSFVEGFGMVTLEAMAAGLPVIVTDHSKGVVRHGIDGFVLRPGDTEALARCMMQLAEEPDLRAEMSRNACERARQFTWDRFGSELCDWLNSVAHLGPGHAAESP